MEDSFESTFKVNDHKSIRDKPWVVSTFVLGFLVVLFVAGSLFNFSLTGNAVSSADIGKLAVDFANNNLLSTAGTLDSVKKVSGVYQVNMKVSDEVVSLYFTKDGKWISQGGSLYSIAGEEETGTETTTEVPKTDKPSVGLYIWSYCPYGVTALTPFAEVATLLEKYADFNVYLYYAGHGEHEVQQNKIQACIQELGYDKYWEYAETFASQIYTKCSGNISCDLKESTALMKSLGINSDVVLSCVESQGEALVAEHSAAASSVGVTGSPSLVINGVIVSASRTAEAYKTAVCSAFNNAPSECSETLSSAAASTSGNC